MGIRQAFPSLRPREPRIKVCVPARMRVGDAWTDAFILNVSSRGLLIHSSEPVERGMYLELRRGNQVIVARVVWRSGSCAGLRAQDRVPVEAMVTSGAVRPASREEAADCERRGRAPSREEEHEHSRLRGRSLEFAFVGLVGALLSVAAFALVAEALAQPFVRVGAALSGQASLPADSR